MRIERNDGLMMVLLQSVIVGRFSKGYLELRKGETARSDGLMTALLDCAADMPMLGTPRPPFFAPELSQADFAQSPAYRNMVELGLSPDDMLAAIKPYQLAE